MGDIKPERYVDSSTISAQHSRIMEEMLLLTNTWTGHNIEEMKNHFDIFIKLLIEHFECEEEVLEELGHPVLAVQRKEHAMLTRMLGNMRALMEESGLPRWHTTVVDETINGLARHFAKEDDEFAAVIDRYRHRIRNNNN